MQRAGLRGARAGGWSSPKRERGALAFLRWCSRFSLVELSQARQRWPLATSAANRSRSARALQLLGAVGHFWGSQKGRQRKRAKYVAGAVASSVHLERDRAQILQTKRRQSARGSAVLA